VRDIAVLAKHQWLDPKRSGNRGRDLISQNHLEAGAGAAFDDGTYWSNGTSWIDTSNVVRVRDDHGALFDVLFCVQDAVAAIRKYLASRSGL
jgi:hypothetical protein